LVRYCASQANPRRTLDEALQRRARSGAGTSKEIDRIIERLSSSEDLPWAIAVAHSRLRRRENSLPEGTVFTPPWLANCVVDCLSPDLPVVDLGAGSGMLALAAAKRGFRVIAVEQDPELAAILDSLARIMKLRRLIELRVEDALSYSRRSEGQIMANPPFTATMRFRRKRSAGWPRLQGI
jgi:SAM-dependent methyltransferase